MPNYYTTFTSITCMKEFPSYAFSPKCGTLNFKIPPYLVSV